MFNQFEYCNLTKSRDQFGVLTFLNGKLIFKMNALKRSSCKVYEMYVATDISLRFLQHHLMRL